MPKKVWISGLWRGGIRRLLDDSLLSNLNFNIWLLDVYAMTHFFFLTTEKIARFFIVPNVDSVLAALALLAGHI